MNLSAPLCPQLCGLSGTIGDWQTPQQGNQCPKLRAPLCTSFLSEIVVTRIFTSLRALQYLTILFGLLGQCSMVILDRNIILLQAGLPLPKDNMYPLIWVIKNIGHLGAYG